MGPTETKCHLYSDFFKSRKNIHTMRIQSVYFLHHGASLRGSAWDCVYGGWAEVRLEAAVFHKTPEQAQAPQGEQHDLVLLIRNNFCQDQMYNRWIAACLLRMFPKWWKPSFLRRLWCPVWCPMRVTSCPHTSLRSGKGSTPTSTSRSWSGHLAPEALLRRRHQGVMASQQPRP